MKTADFEIRTDLALEEREGLKEQDKRSIRGFLFGNGRESQKRYRSQK